MVAVRVMACATGLQTEWKINGSQKTNFSAGFRTLVSPQPPSSQCIYKNVMIQALPATCSSKVFMILAIQMGTCGACGLSFAVNLERAILTGEAF